MTVQADPDDLRRFAATLRVFKNDLETRLNSLNAQLRGLRWSDEQQRRFADEWLRTSRDLRSFLAQVDDHAPYLEKKARQLEEYYR